MVVPRSRPAPRCASLSIRNAMGDGESSKDARAEDGMTGKIDQELTMGRGLEPETGPLLVQVGQLQLRLDGKGSA